MRKQSNANISHKNSLPAGKLTYALAWASESWERLWPLLVWAFMVSCLYAIVSWFGMWRALEDVWRYGFLALFAVLGMISLLPLKSFKAPNKEELIDRIERATNLKDRPITAQIDDLAAAGSEPEDAFSKALWTEHKNRMAQRLENLSAGAPRPNANKLDSYALRAILPIIAVVAWSFSFSLNGGALIDGFKKHIDPVAILSRLDAWVTSPAYTGLAPIYVSNNYQLTNQDDASTEAATDTANIASKETLKLITASTMNLRYIGEEDVGAQFKIGEEVFKIDTILDTDENGTQVKNFSQANLQEHVFEYALEKNGTFQFLANEQVIAEWPIEVFQDEVPKIAFLEVPKSSLSSSLEFSYEVEDDFGVISATGQIRSLAEQKPNARPLVQAPNFDLSLPRRRAKSGSVKANKDLTAHPWAGSQVELQLDASDDLNQKGYSQAFKLQMPARNFSDEMALALIEQRRILAFDANESDYVADLLDAVTQFPVEFDIDQKAYLSMRTAYRMIEDATPNAVGETKLREAMELLWEIALELEFGDLTEAERKLREAQERLSKALENNASDEEIEQLMDELRSAMNDFIEEMQRQMANNQDIQNPLNNMDPSQMLSKNDLDKMMDQIENLAKSGSKDAARQMLSEMQRMMDNLKAGQQQNQQANNQLNKALDEFSKLLEEQQRLMNETFSMQKKREEQQRSNQKQNQQGQQQQQNQQGQQQQQQGQQQQQQNGQQQQSQPGQEGKQDQPQMSAEEFAQAMKDLQAQQESLRKQLGEIGKKLEQQGLDPSKGFGEAETEMGQAGDELGEGQAGEATGSQSRALQALRQGAQQMMQQMAQGQGQGQPGGQQAGGQSGRNGTDPLGRSQESGGTRIREGKKKIPSEIDAQRAREIKEAIRKRLSNPLRHTLEKNYLERLLKSQ
ncbi:MAG: TIGR02302 family protein [Nitratireductor sp.]